MYLAELNEQQKELFLDLSIHIAMSDRDFCGEEKQIMEQLCSEMNIPLKYTAEKNLEEVLEQLEHISSNRIKRIILIELTGVVMSDNQCTDNEKEILKKVCDIFGINHDEIHPLIEIVHNLYSIYRKFDHFLNQ